MLALKQSEVQAPDGEQTQRGDGVVRTVATEACKALLTLANVFSFLLVLCSAQQFYWASGGKIGGIITTFKYSLLAS